jgi:hypothetical protein
MTRARRLAVLVVAGLVAALPACVSLKRTPEARFFVLRTLAEPPGEAGAVPALVGLLPVALPGYLERPQLITWVAPSELRVDEYLRWAEPLDAGLARTLAANLETLLPGGRVIRSPWPATASARLRCRVRVELQRFGPQASGEVVLEGRFALLPADGERPLVARPVALVRGPLAATAAGGGATATDATAGVEAMSELVADLARELASAIRALPPTGGETG